MIVQRKLFFKFYLMHRCSCKTQVLSACCRIDWLKKRQQQQNIIFDTTIFLQCLLI